MKLSSKKVISAEIIYEEKGDFSICTDFFSQNICFHQKNQRADKSASVIIRLASVKILKNPNKKIAAEKTIIPKVISIMIWSFFGMESVGIKWNMLPPAALHKNTKKIGYKRNCKIWTNKTSELGFVHRDTAFPLESMATYRKHVNNNCKKKAPIICHMLHFVEVLFLEKARSLYIP